MTADYFSMTGHDIWHRTDKTVHQLKNLHTGEIVVCEEIGPKFQAVIMPKGSIKKKDKIPKTNKTKKEKIATAGHKITSSKYKGVRQQPNGKWVAWYWDGKKKKCISLGTFGDEIEAGASVLEAKGDLVGAQKLRGTAGASVKVTGGPSYGDYE